VIFRNHSQSNTSQFWCLPAGHFFTLRLGEALANVRYKYKISNANFLKVQQISGTCPMEHILSLFPDEPWKYLNMEQKIGRMF